MKHRDFMELASLYVLGALDERDNRLIENYAETSEELKNELIHLQMAALAIPYGSEQYDLPVGLKARLFEKINSEHPTETPIVTPQIELTESYQIKADEVNWLPHPDRVEGIAIAPLFVDRDRRKFSGLVRCDVGAIYPAHRHITDEEILILEGDLIVDGKSFGVGGYIYSVANSLHAPISNINGCLFFIRTCLDNDFI
jgi:ChrR Cupin-like domain